MKLRLVWIALLISLFAVMAWFIEPFMLGLSAIFMLLLVAPVLLVTFVCLWVGWQRAKPFAFVIPTLQALLIIACFFLLLFPVNRHIFLLAVDETKAFASVLVPHLEVYRQNHSIYPTALADLPDLPPLPRLLKRGSSGYGSNGESYSLWFADPAGTMMDCWNFESSSGKWHYST